MIGVAIWRTPWVCASCNQDSIDAPALEIWCIDCGRYLRRCVACHKLDADPDTMRQRHDDKASAHHCKKRWSQPRDV